VFLDGILVYSNTREDHEEHLRMVLHVLREHQVYANFRKYDLFQKEIHYLVHIMSVGVAIDLEKIKEIMDCPSPRNLTEVIYFMRLDRCYRRFIKGFSKVGNPITSL
jgi:hypothetical protein